MAKLLIRFLTVAAVLFTALLLTVQNSSAWQTRVVNGNYTFDYDVFNNTANRTLSLRLRITANTTGWVGFGVGPNSNMVNADLFIGGFNASNPVIAQRKYGGDYFGRSNGQPSLDARQNWFLEDASESGNRTIIQAVRLLDTGDRNEDFIITNTTMNVLWSYGMNDTLSQQHGSGHRGFIRLNLLAGFGGGPGPTPAPPTSQRTTARQSSTTKKGGSGNVQASIVSTLLILFGVTMF